MGAGVRLGGPGLQGRPAAHELGARECSVDLLDRPGAVVVLVELRAGLASESCVELGVELVCCIIAGHGTDVEPQALRKEKCQVMRHSQKAAT